MKKKRKNAIFYFFKNEPIKSQKKILKFLINLNKSFAVFPTVFSKHSLARDIQQENTQKCSIITECHLAKCHPAWRHLAECYDTTID